MNAYLIVALLSALFYAGMYVLDKYIISRKLYNDGAYLSFVGIVYIVYSAIIALFLNWRNISAYDLIIPILVGIIICVQTHFYMKLQHTEDISHVAGLEYVYPILVAILSFIFLNERLSVLSYVGALIIISGALILSVRLHKIKNSIIMIIFLIIVVALNEFIIKISTSQINALNGAIISLMTFGFVQSLRLFSKNARTNLITQARKIVVILLITEIIGFLALITLYLAMSNISATIVSTIATMQVLFVLVLEKIADKHLGTIIKDHLLTPKIIGIVLVIVGAIVLLVA